MSCGPVHTEGVGLPVGVSVGAGFVAAKGCGDLTAHKFVMASDEVSGMGGFNMVAHFHETSHAATDEIYCHIAQVSEQEGEVNVAVFTGIRKSF